MENRSNAANHVVEDKGDFETNEDDSDTEGSDSDTDSGSAADADEEKDTEGDVENDTETGKGGTNEADPTRDSVPPVPPARNPQSAPVGGEQGKPLALPNGMAPDGGAPGQTFQNEKIQHPHQMLSQANLSNFYTVRLDESGDVLSWFSDRPELYSDQQIAESITQILTLEADSRRMDRTGQAHSREIEGNGLRPAIAKTIAAAHSGKIMAESEPGHWACFTVTLSLHDFLRKPLEILNVV